MSAIWLNVAMSEVRLAVAAQRPIDIDRVGRAESWGGDVRYPLLD